MGGAISSCCCGLPQFHGERKIWTKRPWGVFWKPFSVAYWEGTTYDVLGGESGTDVVGTAGSWTADLMDPYDSTDDADIIWHGTRYRGLTTHDTIVIEAHDGYDAVDLERWDHFYIDPNTGTQLEDSYGDTLIDGSHPSMANIGYLVTYVEDVTATTRSRISTFQHGVITYEETLTDSVTWADQVARCKDHLDYNVSTMTEAQLKGTMVLVGASNVNWGYARVTTPANLPATSYVNTAPLSGTLVAESTGAYTYTEWTPGTDQVLTTNSSLDGATSGFYLVYGGARRGSTNYVGVTSGGYVVDLGTYSSGEVVDSNAAIMQYACVCFHEPYDCDTSKANLNFPITQTLATDRPAWDADVCASPESVFDPGWYLITTDGVALAAPTGVTHTLTLPTTEYFSVQFFMSTCCPP